VTITKGNHCAYDTHYHIVLPLKYRKSLLSSEVVATMRQTMKGIEERYDLTIEQFGDDTNHIHLLLSFHPKYSIGQVVRLFKSITARHVFSNHPVLKRDLWGGEFWTDGYYVATVGTGGNWDVVKNYIKNQKHNPGDLQLTIW
jgi:putative transposase